MTLGDQLFDQARQAQAHRVALGQGAEVDHVLLHQGAQDIETGAGVDLQLPGDVHRAFRCPHLTEIAQDANGVGNGLDEGCAGRFGGVVDVSEVHGRSSNFKVSPFYPENE
ncbi:hypothetical protein D3C72_2161850 [compost metagenome]